MADGRWQMGVLGVVIVARWVEVGAAAVCG